MRPLRFMIGVLATSFIMACGSAAPSDPSPKHIHQSTRHLNLAAEHYLKGCYSKALNHYQQAHERYTAADQIDGVAHSLNGIANVYYRLDKLPSAVAAYNEAYGFYELIQDRSGMVQVICNKATALVAAGRLDKAEASLDQADQLSGTDGIKPALRGKSRAILMLHRNRLKAAKTLLQTAIQSANQSEIEQLPSICYTMGRLLMEQKRPSQAVVYLQKSLSLDRDAGAYDDIAHDLEALDACHAQLNQLSTAAGYLKRSIKIYALLGNAAKVQTLSNRLASYPATPERGIQTTLHWATQWLAGEKEANLCR